MSAFATDFYLGFGFLYSLESGHFCFLDIFVFLLGYAKGQYKTERSMSMVIPCLRKLYISESNIKIKDIKTVLM